MRIALAYTGILLIWGTTPLAIKWSSEGLGFLLSVSVRMVMAALVAVPLVLLLEQRLPLKRQALQSYLAGAIGVFGAMLAVYWSAQYIPSGLVSIMFGLAPLITGVLAFQLLNERLGWAQLAGVVVSLSGLVVVFSGELGLGSSAARGVLGLLVAVSLYSLSHVLVKRIQAEVTPFQQTTGTLLVSALGYLALVLVVGPATPEAVGERAWYCLLYLALVCSLLGFFLFFYVLRAMSAGAVSLVTLITPVIAVVLGVWLNDEHLSSKTLLGAGLIGLGLLCYQRQIVLGLLWRYLSKAASKPKLLKEEVQADV